MKNPTLHIITDSREPSVTCAAKVLRTEFPAHEIQVYSARATDMKTALLRMREQFNDGDHILITMLSADRQEASRALRQSLSGLEPHTSWYASQYEEKIPSRGTLAKISKLCDTHGIRYEINKFEKKRTLAKMSGEEEPEQIWERLWIQYRLMRAIVCGQKLEEAIRDILETLQLFSFEDKKIIPRKSNRGLGDKKSRLEIELKRAEQFLNRGEPDMAGGSYGFQGEANPGKLDLLRQRLVQIARTDLNVLISGDTGTGKESLAWFIYDLSKRGRLRGEFIALNCACFSDELLESELFGHKEGAFTGAGKEKKGILQEADGGVIFLDELHHISPRVQAKLMRFLQEGEFLPLGDSSGNVITADVRIIRAIQPKYEGNLPEDFYQRIAVTTLSTIPLCEMEKKDKVNIARNLAERMTWEEIEPEDLCGKPIVIKPDRVRAFRDELRSGPVATLLDSYEWPGNMREMNNMIQKKLLLGWDLAELIEEAKEKRARRTAPDSIEIAPHSQFRQFLKPIRSMEELKSRNLNLKDLEIEYLKYILNCISDLPRNKDGKLRPGPISAAFGIGQQAMKEKLIAAGFECTGKY